MSSLDLDLDLNKNDSRMSFVTVSSDLIYLNKLNNPNGNSNGNHW